MGNVTDWLLLALVIVLALNLPLAASIGYKWGYAAGTWSEHAAISAALRHNYTPYRGDASDGYPYGYPYGSQEEEGTYDD